MKRIYFHKHEGEGDIKKAVLRHESKYTPSKKHSRIRRLLNKDKRLLRYIAFFCHVRWEHGRWEFSRIQLDDNFDNGLNPYNLDYQREVRTSYEKLLEITSGEIERTHYKEWWDINHIIRELKELKLVIGVPSFPDNKLFFEEIGVTPPTPPKKRVVGSKTNLTDLAYTVPVYDVKQTIDQNEVVRCLAEIKAPGDTIEKPHPLFSYWLRRSFAEILGGWELEDSENHLTAKHLYAVMLYKGEWVCIFHLQCSDPVTYTLNPRERAIRFMRSKVGWGREVYQWLPDDVGIFENDNAYLTLMLPLEKMGRVFGGYNWNDRIRMNTSFKTRKDGGLQIDRTDYVIQSNPDFLSVIEPICAIAGYTPEHIATRHTIRLSHEARVSREVKLDTTEAEKQQRLNKLWK